MLFSSGDDSDNRKLKPCLGCIQIFMIQSLKSLSYFFFLFFFFSAWPIKFSQSLWTAIQWLKFSLWLISMCGQELFLGGIFPVADLISILKQQSSVKLHNKMACLLLLNNFWHKIKIQWSFNSENMYISSMTFLDFKNMNLAAAW